MIHLVALNMATDIPMPVRLKACGHVRFAFDVKGQKDIC
jgi:hypothetical protein